MSRKRPLSNSPSCPNHGTVQPGRGENWSHPVTIFDKYAAKAFVQFVGARFSIHVEWACATQGREQTMMYPWPNEDPDCDHPIFDNCIDATSPVCRHLHDITNQGRCDLAGNAAEWLEDDLDYHFQRQKNDGSFWARYANRNTAGCLR